MYNKRKLVGDYKSVKGNISLTITLDMAWAVSFIANLLKKGTSIMFQICAACVGTRFVFVLVSLQVMVFVL
jgi:hypothetical protein